MNSRVIKTWPAKIAIAILAITIFPWEYGVYMVGKFFIFIIAIYYCYNVYNRDKEKQDKYFWYFLGAAILYNPIIPIHLFYRMLWIIVDVAFIIFLINYIKHLDAGLHKIDTQQSTRCTKCGSHNNPKFNYCSNCGQELTH